MVTQSTHIYLKSIYKGPNSKMINSKITKVAAQQTTEERLFKLLESIDWKLWEMYNILKDQTGTAEKKPAGKSSKIAQAVTKKGEE